jgi:hypothetical protein
MSKNSVEACHDMKERKAYCRGTQKGSSDAPVTECAEVKPTGLLGVVVGSVGGMFDDLTIA